MPKLDEETREYHRTYQREWRRRKRLGLPGKYKTRSTAAKVLEPIGGAGQIDARPNPETLLELRARLTAPHRTQIGMLLGDPPVGYSALDRER